MRRACTCSRPIRSFIACSTLPGKVNARSVTVNRIADAVLGALALAVPEKVGAQSCGVPVGVSFGGINPDTGRNFVFYESYSGGMGGNSMTERSQS